MVYAALQQEGMWLMGKEVGPEEICRVIPLIKPTGIFLFQIKQWLIQYSRSQTTQPFFWGCQKAVKEDVGLGAFGMLRVQQLCCCREPEVSRVALRFVRSRGTTCTCQDSLVGNKGVGFYLSLLSSLSGSFQTSQAEADGRGQYILLLCSCCL